MEFWKLEIKFGNRNFEELFENDILENQNLKIGILRNYFENGIFIRMRFRRMTHGLRKGGHAWPNTPTYALYIISNSNQACGIPSQNSFLHVFKPIPNFIVLFPVHNQPIFIL